MSDRDDLLDNQNNENKTHMANLVKSNSYLAEVVKTLNALLMGLPPPAKPETGQPEPSRDITPAVNENEINKDTEAIKKSYDDAIKNHKDHIKRLHDELRKKEKTLEELGPKHITESLKNINEIKKLLGELNDVITEKNKAITTEIDEYLISMKALTSLNNLLLRLKKDISEMKLEDSKHLLEEKQKDYSGHSYNEMLQLIQSITQHVLYMDKLQKILQRVEEDILNTSEQGRTDVKKLKNEFYHLKKIKDHLGEANNALISLSYIEASSNKEELVREFSSAIYKINDLQKLTNNLNIITRRELYMEFKVVRDYNTQKTKNTELENKFKAVKNTVSKLVDGKKYDNKQAVSALNFLKKTTLNQLIDLVQNEKKEHETIVTKLNNIKRSSLPAIVYEADKIKKLTLEIEKSLLNIEKLLQPNYIHYRRSVTH